MKPDSFTYLLSVSELEVARERMKTSRMKKEPIEMLFLLVVVVILLGSLAGYCWFRECTGYLSFIYQHSLYIFGGGVILVWIAVLISKRYIC